MLARLLRRLSARSRLTLVGSVVVGLAVTGVAAAAVGLVGFNPTFGFSRVGDVVNGRVLLPDNQWISPYGSRYTILDHTALGSALKRKGEEADAEK